MMNRFLDRLIVLLFFAVLILPGIQQHYSPFTIPALDENRNRLTMPDGEIPDGTLLERIYRRGQSYSSAYEKYFNDHYGFRDFLIRAKNQLDFTLFGHSDTILIGKDNYLFFREQLERDLVTADNVPQATIDQVYNGILKLAEWCRDRKKLFVVLLCREKESIYADKLSNPTVRRPALPASEVYASRFAREPSLLFLDSRDTLLSTRKKLPVFYRTDFHWTTVGAFEVGRDLVDKIASGLGSEIRWRHRLQTEPLRGYSGTQNLYLAIFSPEAETIPEVKHSWEESSFAPVPLPHPFEEVRRAKTPGRNSSPLLPPTVIIGNSFTPYFFKTPLPEYFESISYAFKGWLHYMPLERLISPETKVVVLQVNEFDLGTYYANPEIWAKIALEQSAPRNN